MTSRTGLTRWRARTVLWCPSWKSLEEQRLRPHSTGSAWGICRYVVLATATVARFFDARVIAGAAPVFAGTGTRRLGATPFDRRLAPSLTRNHSDDLHSMWCCAFEFNPKCLWCGRLVVGHSSSVKSRLRCILIRSPDSALVPPAMADH